MRDDRNALKDALDARARRGLLSSIFLHRRSARILADPDGLPETLARTGSLELKFALADRELRAAQKLRYTAFYEQGVARPDQATRLRRRDICAFDPFCDHLIVIDHDARNARGKPSPRVVGNYRLLRPEGAAAAGGFYSASEFDVAALLARHPGKRFLELGRSCVLPEYRSRRVLELLWRGVWLYARHHGIDAMFGCASLPGADPAAHRPALDHIARTAIAREPWRVPLLAGRNGALAAAPNDGAAPNDRDAAIARPHLPPLIKGYLRLGARFAEGYFVDRQFGVVDLFVVLPVADIDARYVAYFSAPPIDAPVRAA